MNSDHETENIPARNQFCISRGSVITSQRRIQNPVEHLQRNFFAKIVNPIRPESCQIKARQFKMNTILDWFSTLVPSFMAFSFQVLCTISEKIGLCRASFVSLRSYTQFQVPTHNSKSKILVLQLQQAEFLPLSP